MSAIDTLVRAATLAPSGDNTQPWSLEVNEEARRLAFFVNETRDRSPMNAGQRMARIAIGSAVENVLQAAKHNGWSVE